MKQKGINDKLSDEARKRLVEIMGDTPTFSKFEDTEFKLTALKNGTLIKICEEAVKIKKAELDKNDKSASVMIAMASQIPVICRIITYALLNDLDKIRTQFDEVYEIVLNKTSQKDIFNLFLEVFNKLDVDFFFTNIESVETLLQMLTNRRLTTKEQKAL